MISRIARATATSGLPVTGAIRAKDIIGFPARGCSRQRRGFYGLPDFGVILAAATATTTDIGGGISVITAESITAMDTTEWGTKAATGKVTALSTTEP